MLQLLSLTAAILQYPRLNWRRNLLIFCVAMSEVLWIAPLIQWFLILFDDPFPMPLNAWIGLVAGNVAVALILRRVLNSRRMTNQQQLPYILVAFGVAVLLSVAVLPILMGTQDSPSFDFGAAFDFTQETIPNGIILIPIILMLFGRGSAIGAAQLTYSGVGTLVRFGILMLFLTALMASMPIGERVKGLRDGLVAVLPPFFFFALIASALARSASLRVEDSVRNERFGLPWLGFLVAVAMMVTLVGIVVAVLLAGVDREQAFMVIKFPFVAIITVLFVVAAPFLYVFDILITWLSDFLTNEGPEQVIEEGVGQQPLREDRGLPQIDIGDELRAVVDFLTKGVGIAILVGIVVVVVGFWVVAFLTREGGAGIEESSEALDVREKTGGGWRKAIGDRFKRLTDALGLVRQFGLGSDLFAAFTIRWAYSRMESMGKKRGFARGRSQTPYEYRAMLYKAFPGAEDDVRVITDAYVAIRYGELPEELQDVSHVKDALERLKTMPSVK